MASRDPDEYYERLLKTDGKIVEYEVAAAIYDTARLWATLAESLMFAIEKEGLWSLAPDLTKEYNSACLEEPVKFSTPSSPA
jgi:hypothetical protein